MMQTTAPVKVVCPFDPALEMNLDQAAEYAEKRDPALLKCKPGEAPTEFYIQRIHNSVVLNFMQTTTAIERRHVLAFMVGVVEVRNLRAEGGIIPLWRPSWCSAQKQGEHMKDDELDLFALDEILDIGSVAYQRSFLRPGRTPCYVPPDSSAYALAMLVRSSRPAVTQDPPSTKSTELKELPRSTNESDGATPGAATAADPSSQA